MTRKLYELWGCFAPPYPPADACLLQLWQSAGKPMPNPGDPSDQINKIIVRHKRNEANIRNLSIRHNDRVFPPPNPSIKSIEELTRLFRDMS